MVTPTKTPKLTNDGLRRFGLLTSGMLILFFAVLIPWIWDLDHPVWPWATAVILGTVALVAPGRLGPVYRLWMRFAEVLGWINTRIILGLVFFLIILPVGLLMRLFNDPMRRTTDADTLSYRVASHPPKKENMEKPF